MRRQQESMGTLSKSSLGPLSSRENLDPARMRDKCNTKVLDQLHRLVYKSAPLHLDLIRPLLTLKDGQPLSIFSSLSAGQLDQKSLESLVLSYQCLNRRFTQNRRQTVDPLQELYPKEMPAEDKVDQLLAICSLHIGEFAKIATKLAPKLDDVSHLTIFYNLNCDLIPKVLNYVAGCTESLAMRPESMYQLLQAVIPLLVPIFNSAPGRASLWLPFPVDPTLDLAEDLIQKDVVKKALIHFFIQYSDRLFRALRRDVAISTLAVAKWTSAPPPSTTALSDAQLTLLVLDTLAYWIEKGLKTVGSARYASIPHATATSLKSQLQQYAQITAFAALVPSDTKSKTKKQALSAAHSFSHASKCLSSTCRLANCSRIRADIEHSKKCPILAAFGSSTTATADANQECKVCRGLIELVWYHSKDCHAAKCEVIYCDLLKPDAKETTLRGLAAAFKMINFA